MNIESRKIRVWLISLSVLVGIFLIYNMLSSGPDFKIESVAGPDTEVVDFNSQTGNISDTGIGPVRKAVFIDVDEITGQLSRKWGFEKLLHEQGDAWEIEKPFMDIFSDNLTCRVTADTGMLLLEPDANPPSPKEGTLAGNVVIHIIPTDDSSAKESFIYLDDLVFISEMSLFRTDGPVDFNSEDIELSAKGMELAYNDETDTLEFLRLMHLYQLKIKTGKQTATDEPAAIAKEQPAILKSPAKTTTPTTQPETQPQIAKTTSPAKKASLKYRCIINGNVAIDAPDQLVFADKVVIHNILASKSSKQKADNEKPAPIQTKPKKALASTAKPTQTLETIETFEIDLETAEQPTGNPETVLITCDKGMLVTPMGSSLTQEDFDSWGLNRQAATKPALTTADANGRTTFVTESINHYADTEKTIAKGRSQITFYIEDNNSQKILPVKVTAQKSITHYPDLNQIIFAGDCVAQMLKYENNILQKQKLSADKLQIDLTDTETTNASQLKHITADGKLVKLSSIKKDGDKLLSGVELKCQKFDYDPIEDSYTATGPGNIAVNNANIAVPTTKEEKFSFKKPCYAVVQNFDTLKFFSRDGKLITDSKTNQMEILYVPIINGEYGQATNATASHIEANFAKTTTGESKLSTLHASGGVTYHEDADPTKGFNAKPLDIVANEFFYNAESNMINLWGSDFQPALLNGSLTPGIKYNLKTGRLKKTRITGIGTF